MKLSGNALTTRGAEPTRCPPFADSARIMPAGWVKESFRPTSRRYLLDLGYRATQAPPRPIVPLCPWPCATQCGATTHRIPEKANVIASAISAASSRRPSAMGPRERSRVTAHLWRRGRPDHVSRFSSRPRHPTCAAQETVVDLWSTNAPNARLMRYPLEVDP